MMNDTTSKRIFRTLGAILCLSIGLFSADKKILWPGGDKPELKPNTKGFAARFEGAEIALNFSDLDKSDDYIHIDFGVFDLSPYLDGGYVEVRATIDQPIVMTTAVVADPKDFWPGRQTLEGEGVMIAGEYVYRFYIDGLWAERVAQKRDHLYLFFHNLGGKPLGDAEIRVRSVALYPPVPNWREEKRAAYSRQYRWPEVKKIEPLYYEELGRARRWEEVSGSPILSLLPLDGSWKKKYFGERTWDYAFLGDVSPASTDFGDGDWSTVQVPEASVSDQTGGHFWYRKEFEISQAQLGEKCFLRFDDLADEARIFLNGSLVGTQTPVEKRQDWVVENGSRVGMMLGVPVKKALNWKNFERVGIPPPFDAKAIPENENRLILPIVTGQYDYPLAYDVTPLLKPGKNVLALRLYGNPMRGFWIFRHRFDRGSKNIYGILGGVKLGVLKRAAVAGFIRLHPTTTTEDGRASHRLECSVNDPGGTLRYVRLSVDGETKSLAVTPGKSSYAADFILPASFARHRGLVSLIDDRGAVVDTREISFHGAVVEIRNKILRVNGDIYQIRGINGMAGIEWNNDRTKTRRESLRLLRFYEQLGFNTVRSEGNEVWELDDAFAQGMMVMPVTCGASTDRGIQIFGQYVDPDLRLATDRHRTLSILLSETPNILFWNGGNEIHHTPGYDDRPILQNYLGEIQKAFHSQDAYRRPVTFANLDTWLQNWFFLGGQDVVGWNIYKPVKAVNEELPQVLAAAGGRPIVFTEWGTLDGKKDREGKVEEWEKDMRGKWALITKTPGTFGGFLYAFHGELEDARGLEFLKELFLPYAIEKKDESFVFKNRSEAPMRALSLQFVSGGSVVNGELIHELKPGESVEVKLLSPLLEKGARILEIRYESHRGLKHFYSKEI
ncbi:MAG: hypothetical protein JNM63_11400 [Spirochaetia bacterium]|nr:hypothetical protein [Spirochaetia bacterium]